MRELYTRWTIRKLVNNIEHPTYAVCRLPHTKDTRLLQGRLEFIFPEGLRDFKFFDKDHEDYPGYLIIEVSSGDDDFRLIQSDVL